MEGLVQCIVTFRHIFATIHTKFIYEEIENRDSGYAGIKAFIGKKFSLYSCGQFRQFYWR